MAGTACLDGPIAVRPHTGNVFSYSAPRLDGTELRVQVSDPDLPVGAGSGTVFHLITY